MARSSRLSVCFEIESRNSPIPIGSDRQCASERRHAPPGSAGCPALSRSAGRPRGVEPQNPVTHGLKPHPADRCRRCARLAGIDCRKRQQPPDLTRVGCRPRQLAKLWRIKICSQRDRRSHGGPHPVGRPGESHFAPQGNPLRESHFTGLGIRSRHLANLQNSAVRGAPLARRAASSFGQFGPHTWRKASTTFILAARLAGISAATVETATNPTQMVVIKVQAPTM